MNCKISLHYFLDTFYNFDIIEDFTIICQSKSEAA